MKKSKRVYAVASMVLAFALVVASGIGLFGGIPKADANTYTIQNWHPGHYLLTPKDTPISTYESLLQTTSADGTPIFRGVQQRYNWKDLEPSEGYYDFTSITNDMSYLINLKDVNGNPLHLKLVIQIQTKGFQQGEREVPDYITGSDYGGGVYQIPGGGYAPIRWNDNVRARLKALYAALGEQFNGYYGLESVVLDETAIGSLTDINSQNISPPVTYQSYADAVSDGMAALKTAFPNTVVIQFTNGPRQSLSSIPGNITTGTGIIDAERNNGVGLGGPDIATWSDLSSNLVGANNNPGAYAFYSNYWGFSNVTGSEMNGIVPLGAAVQYPDYFSDAAGTAPATISSIFTYGTEKLNLNYVYWLYKADRINDVVDYLKTVVSTTDRSGGLVRTRPSMVN